MLHRKDGAKEFMKIMDEGKMTNLRDWQKKASEKLGTSKDQAVKIWNNVVDGYEGNSSFRWPAIQQMIDKRDAEIDLLLQIIEKQSEALEFYANGGNFNYDLWIDKESGAHFTGKTARATQAEVQGLVEKLMGEK